MSGQAQLIYGTCVALGESAALLRGPSGSGKSDLALRFVLGMDPVLDAALVSDDQLSVAARGGRLIGSPPPALAGRLEVRGVGIVTLPYRREAELKLIVELSEPDDVPRFPPPKLPTETVCGVALPVLALAPFEASAPLKLRLALQRIAH
ncbi:MULTISPECIES: HPr kinase/phosphatase C-terminal domain-containing protein [Rhodomicrobium]|uniref:HPr kinase/phosphorylase n=1 Tax=Rhodomicrobium TaxID=1068 RepID=UPI000B4BE220|nr:MULTISPECIES: HPr kinase/phosphatase C-terminal domain-containing protein [Rhodomicrobium]